MHYDEHYSTKFNAKKKCISDFAELMFVDFDLTISFHNAESIGKLPLQNYHH